MNDASTPEPLPAALIGEDGHPLTRLQIKEACKLAYCSGRARLTDLCVKYRVPYDTLRNWSQAENWTTVTLVEVRSQAALQTVPAIADWVAKQREEQIRRAISRGSRVHKALDKLLDDETKSFEPKELQSIACAELNVDTLIRRNLGMDSESQSKGPLVNLNMLGTVEIHEAKQ